MNKSRQSSSAPGSFILVVLGGQSSGTHQLPERGRISIGRAPESDVVIDDPSVSRQHALLEVGATLKLRDLGSANGTRVRAALTSERRDETAKGPADEYRLKPHETVEVTPGAMMQFGTALAVVQPAARSLVEQRPVRGPATAELFQLAERAAATDVTVLLLGETGVGKGVVAEYIHRASPRAKHPLVVLNSAALPEALLESELFGHERGAFTGANEARPGLIEAARHGTLFLDEVGELAPAIQAKLLGVLETKSVLRLGAREPREVDVRFVMATNKHLEREVEAGRFREDLLFRINVFSLLVPPLRERSAELLPLARQFVDEMARRMGRPAPKLDPAVLETLAAHSWPGNVRELRNVIERALVLCAGDSIQLAHLPEALRQVGARDAAGAAPATPGVADDLRASVRDLERQRILAALEQCAGNQTRAAELLGISRRMLVKRLDAYGVPRPRKQRHDGD